MVYRAIPKTCETCGRNFPSGLSLAGHRVHCTNKVERRKIDLEIRTMQKIHFIEPSGPAPGTFHYQCENMVVDFLAGLVKVFIPFTGSERVCWNCGGNRELIVITSLEDGSYVRSKECCDKI